MPFKPINLGNIIAQGEAIQGSRLNNLKLAQSMAPNSPQNRLLNAKVAAEESKANSPYGVVDPTSQMKNDVYRQRLIQSGASQEDIDRFDNWVARQQIVDVNEVPTIVRGGQTTSLSTPEETAAAAQRMAEATERGKLLEQKMIVPEIKNLSELATQQGQQGLGMDGQVAGPSQGDVKASTLQAEAAVKRADMLFDTTAKLETNITNLREARQAVLDGAGTGPIMQYWPSFAEASVRLDSQQGRLGLDIVQSTTFGALSKGELDLSKQIALPTGLSPPALVKWLDDRIEAQERKQSYLTRQAIFLSGVNEQGRQNTKADWEKAEQAAMQRALDAFGATEEDIRATMRAENMDRSAVLAEIRRRYERGGS